MSRWATRCRCISGSGRWGPDRSPAWRWSICCRAGSRWSRMRGLRGAGIAALGGVTAWWGLPRVVRHQPLRARVSTSTAVYDGSGGLLRLTLSADEKYRVWVPLDRMSPLLVNATLLQEDRLFRLHPGVNPLALVRGGWRTYVARGRREGGSTITMQLARLLYEIGRAHVRTPVTGQNPMP